MKNSLGTIILIELAALLKPLEQLDNSSSITSFFQELGWRFPEGQEVSVDLAVLVDLVIELGTVISKLLDASTDEEVLEEVENLAIKIPDIVDTIRSLAPQIETAINAIPLFIGESSDLAEEIPRRILDYLLYLYLQIYHRRVFAVLHILGIVEIVEDDQDIPVRKVQWQRLPQLFFEPLTIAQDVYLWDHDTDPFDGEEFLRRFELLLRAFLLPGGIYRQANDIRAKFKRIEAGDDQEIRMPLYQGGVFGRIIMRSWISICSLSPRMVIKNLVWLCILSSMAT